MTAKYVVMFRAVLAETLLLQLLHARGAEDLPRWVWLLIGSYVAAAAAVYAASVRGLLGERVLLASFLGDAAATLLLSWPLRGLPGDFFIAYFLVILGSCFAERLSLSFLIAGVAAVVYGTLAFPGWDEGLAPAYLLRLSLLLVTAFFSGYIADRARAIERETTERFEARLAWMQRLSTLGRAMSSVLHELKTPLATIRLTADYVRGLRPRARRAELAARLRTIEDEVDKAADIIGDYLDYARPGELAVRPLRLRDVARKSVDSARLRLRERGIMVELRLEADGRVLGSERHLLQVLTNLIQNAIAAMPLGGTLTVRLEEAAGRARLSVTDTGHGIEAERLPRLFEPFAASSSGGHGLGLSIARWIAVRHSGDLILESPGPRRGATAVLMLPLAPPKS